MPGDQNLLDRPNLEVTVLALITAGPVSDGSLSGGILMIIEWAPIAAVCFTIMVLIKLIRKSLTFPMFLEMELIPASCTSQDGNNPKPVISVVIPAKDECHCIKESASQILASKNCRFELILVNDRSQDDTLQLMEELARADARIKLVSVDELPVGWTGKTHAMFLGANIASGEILFFTDADSFLNPNALCTALSHVSSRNLDCLSLLPGFTKRGFIADAIFPILALGLLHYHPLKDVNNPVKPAAMASGSFLMMTRKAYEKIGTWHRLRNEITEDIALAKTVKGQGMRLMVLRGSNLVQMEPFNNLLQVFSFWKRVYYGGLERSASTMLRLIANNVALVTTYVLFGISSAFWLTQATLTITVLFLLTAVAVIIVSILQIAFIRREKGYWIYGLAAPLGFLMGAFVSLSALAALVFHTGIRWHGSRYR